MRRLSVYMMASLAIMSFNACDDDDSNSNSEREDKTQISETTIEANLFVYKTMNEFYYWYDKMPSLNYKTQEDTEEYFESLLYSGDRFSYMITDSETYNEELQGVSTDKGWDYTPMYTDETMTQVCAAINYVHADTPAAESGFKRGDYIYYVDGEAMTADNYYELMTKQSATYTGVRYYEENDTIKYEKIAYEITEREISTTPLAEHTVFDVDGHKIAYLLYLDFYKAFNDDMTSIFEEFKAAGAEDLILDLRYNQGGSGDALINLCSLIAPKANVAAGDVLMTANFNDKLNKQGYKDYYTDNFDTDLASKSLDLNRVVVITGSRSYSASEATMLDLAPYMEVYKIGRTTGGKNTMMFTLTPEIWTYSDGTRYFSTAIDNITLLPIVAEYYNSANETFDTTDGDGMDPDYYMNEYSYAIRGELGESDEPLTAAAIRYITTGSAQESSNKSLGIRESKMSELRSGDGRLVIEPEKVRDIMTNTKL